MTNGELQAAMLGIRDAAIRGQLQVRNERGKWEEMRDIDPREVRIKPQPREWWIWGDFLSPEISNTPKPGHVHVREVLDE